MTLLRLTLLWVVMLVSLAGKGIPTTAWAETPATVLGVVVTPESPSTLYVLAAGPVLASDPRTSPGPLRRYRIYKSVDRGVTWTVVSTPGLQLQRPDSFTVDYAHPSNFYAASLNGVLHVELGDVWQQVNAAPISAVALQVDPANPRVLYASTLGGQVVQRSEDGGRTWKALGLMGNAGANLLLTPDGKTLYAVNSNPGSGGASLYKGTPDGLAWQRVSTPTAYFRALAYDPAAQALYISTRYGAGATSGAIYRLKDGTWQTVKDFGAKAAEVLAVDAQFTKTIYALVDGRLVASEDEGKNWRELTPVPEIPAPIPAAAGMSSYYQGHDGWRVMGRPLSDADIQTGLPAQYFEKGRLEDHASEVSEPAWRYMYGLLADEIQNAEAPLPVGGEVSTVSYADIHMYARAEARVAPPNGFAGGTAVNSNGTVFVPYDAKLRPAPGHNVSQQFWSYINRADLFPGGWLHDIGLPMTEPISALVDKGSQQGRFIVIQAFQRTVLTYDAQNPPEWQVEQANLGRDYRKTFPNRVP